MSKLDRLIRLARVVRSAYEKIYGKSSDLRGACFNASRQLFRLAKDNGLAVEIGISEGHAFVLLDNTVVDVTATQFGKRRKVLVAKRKRLEKQHNGGYWPWRLLSRHSSIGSANRGWGGSCEHTYRQERQVVLLTFKEERR